MRVLVIGAGLMAGEHVKVLDALNVNYTVVGRSKQSAENFEQTYGQKVIYGGLENVFNQLENDYTHAIIATPLENLEENTLFLLENGMKNILLEKPGAVTIEGMKKIARLAEEKKAIVYIAYNRRFYASVLEAKKRIKEDGGLSSFLFEFTEWSHQIEKLNKTIFQLNSWFIGNSTHVVDTAFYLGGTPKFLTGYTQSKLDWHPKGSIFVGAGVTEKNIPFSYHANWEAPGSWKLELLTNSNRYIFRPFEQLHIMPKGKVIIEKVDLDFTLDEKFKPGLYRQIEAFLFGIDAEDLLDVKSMLTNMEWYEKIQKSEETY